MSRKRTGMKRKNFPGRKMQRRREALTRLLLKRGRANEREKALITRLQELTAE